MLDIAGLSMKRRNAGINLKNREVLLTNFRNTKQSEDFTLPPNCNGWGRIHHFHRSQGEGWPLDPLPIDPAIHALGLPSSDEISVEVFQNAICNFRCWYCFVDRQLINANPKYSGFVNVENMLDSYLSEQYRPPVIDLSGGQPDLVPEWILWFADLIHKRNLDKKIYLWSDDNLSTDFLWQFLKKEDVNRLASYKNYGRVGCFKGFDENSFSFNTNAEPDLFRTQFTLMRRLVESGFDVYGYATFTSDQGKNLDSRMADFIDLLQSKVHPIFPLRTIPQRILEFSPTKERVKAEEQKALEIQNEAIQLWQKELEKRYPLKIRQKPIYEHKLIV